MQKILVILVITSLVITIIPVLAASSGFDKKTYTWTDKVFITIVAPDYNFDRYLIDEIGGDSFNPIKITTRGHTLNQYKLVETGPSTGIFTGEVILTGFCHDADGNKNTGANSNLCNLGDDTNPKTEPLQNGGPTNGFIEADNDDGIAVSFKYSQSFTVLDSAPIKWNIGNIHWLEGNYPSGGVGILRVIDRDMNLNPEAVDSFAVDVWSDSDLGGIDLTVTETHDSSGIFEGTVLFTVSDNSSGNRLKVSEGDTVTAEYDDNTLPKPYSTADDQKVIGITTIGTMTSSTSRVTIENTRITDTSGKKIDEISKNQSIQIVSDLQNNQPKKQPFMYIIQIKDSDGVILYLAWLSGSLVPFQGFSSALSWIPQDNGIFEVTAFVWERIDSPISLSQPMSILVDVK